MYILNSRQICALTLFLLGRGSVVCLVLLYRAPVVRCCHSENRGVYQRVICYTPCIVESLFRTTA
jgi:hypothetical protein